MIFVLLSTPTCAFIPKYHCLPFFVWCISGSRCCSRFLVEVGACRMVASTIVPVVIRTPCACRCRFTCPRICSPSWCASSKCRHLHTVVSSGTGSQPLQKYGSPRLPRVLLKASHHRQGPLFHFSDTLTCPVVESGELNQSLPRTRLKCRAGHLHSSG